MRTPGPRRRWRFSAVAAAVALAASAAPAGSTSLLSSPLKLTTSRYIVQGVDATTVHTAVNLLLGRNAVVADLPLVHGVVANLTTADLSLLTAYAVTPDATVLTAMATGKPSPPPPPPPVNNVFRQVTGATAVAGTTTGAGVAVAVVDTGITALPDFGTRLKPGVDLSGERNPQLDGFGHGTFIAGLIAGSGASSGGTYVGEAPGADLVPVKVAGKSGSTNVSTVIQGLQWIADHRSNIRVINMSLGAIPPGPTALNPLDQAVEAMWNNNFVVVTSAGNNGPDRGTITSPGDDPLVITVGALDDKNSVDPGDDSVPDFSSNGPTSWDGWWKPDLLAPGKSVVSVISTRSVIWNSFPSARVGKANFVGSGTSFSAAITSGAAALLLSSSDRSPSAVKAALLTTTNAGPGTTHDPWQQGHGVLNIARAVAEPQIDMQQVFPVGGPPVTGTPIDLLTTQFLSGWSSTDPLEGLLYPLPYTGVATTALSASLDPLFHSSAWNSSEWDSHAWNDGAWDSHAWNDTAWDSHAWNSHAWNTSTWG